ENRQVNRFTSQMCERRRRDIEAQLAPNDYMYTHSLLYSYDNYTNEGILASLAVTPNIILQFGISDGTDTAVTNVGNTILNPNPNPLYPGSRFDKDPGAHIPTFTACARFGWNDGKDEFYPCANGINGGQWGYNNLQWYGFTYYHKWNDRWHFSFEFYDEHQNGVPNIENLNVAHPIHGIAAIRQEHWYKPLESHRDRAVTPPSMPGQNLPCPPPTTTRFCHSHCQVFTRRRSQPLSTVA